MLLEYNYDRAMKVLELMKNAEIASLHIVEKEGKCIMEYTLVKDYGESQQATIRKALIASITKRLALLSLFNDFIVTKSAGKDIHLKLKFNAVNVKQCEIVYALNGHPLIRCSEQNNVTEMQRCLEQCDKLLVNMGVGGQVVDGVYRKEGTGRNKKTTPLTMQDLVTLLRQAFQE